MSENDPVHVLSCPHEDCDWTLNIYQGTRLISRKTGKDVPWSEALENHERETHVTPVTDQETRQWAILRALDVRLNDGATVEEIVRCADVIVRYVVDGQVAK